jgi:prephenate dehydrogenase
MATISVAILGLGRLGASVGLALKRYNDSKDARDKFSITGVDTRAEAQKTGAVDKVLRNPFEAAAEKDIIVVAMPYSEVQPLYQSLAPSLRPGAVIMDFSPLKLPSIQWAEKYLSKEHYLVGMTPVINPAYFFDASDETEKASVDYFDQGTMLLMPSANCAREAVELAADFSKVLGALPHFLDPAEHDGLVAGTEAIPALLGVAAFYMMSKSRGWEDMQRATNPNFAWLTHHLRDQHPDDLRDLLLNNRQNITRYVDEMIEALQGVRSVLQDNDRAALETLLINSAETYQAWLNRRYSGRWEGSETRTSRPPTSELFLSGMMGGFLARKLTGKRGSDTK